MDRNIIRNIAEIFDSVKDVRDVMIANDMEEISVEIPLKFKVTLDELNDCPNDTLEDIIYKDKNWTDAVESGDIRVEKVEEK
jgi:hypothetical protein